MYTNKLTFVSLLVSDVVYHEYFSNFDSVTEVVVISDGRSTMPKDDVDTEAADGDDDSVAKDDEESGCDEEVDVDVVEAGD